MFPKRMILSNGVPLAIRPAQKRDAAATLACINRAGGETDFLTFGRNQFPGSMSDEEHFIQRMQDASNSLMLLAEIDGRVVGILTFEGGQTPRIQHTGEFGISVLQEYWGLGIGSQLVASLIEWARSTGIIRKINLRVHTNNLRAIKLYERFGFKVEGQISREYNVAGQFYDNLAMGLPID